MKTKNTPIIWVLPVTLCILLVMFYAFYSGKNMVRRYVPHMSAALEVKLEAAIAHLWFEEAISGDSYVDIDEEVWRHIDKAEWYANVMLVGGEDSEGEFIPLEDPELRKKVEQTIEGIHAFRLFAQKRWREKDKSGVGTDIDQLFDQTFNKFLASADDVVLAQKRAMNRELEQFSQIQWGLIIALGALAIFMGWFLQRYENRRADDMEALQASESLLAKTQHMALIGSWSQDLASNVMQCSIEACNILEVDSVNSDFSFDGLLKRIHPEDQSFVKQSYNQSIAERTPLDIILRLRFEEGRIKYVNLRCQAVYDGGGKAQRFVGSIQDVTEQKQSEEALRRSQKMDAVGQLTGGIAHDFNNILAIILGNTELLQTRVGGDEKVEKWVQSIEKATERGAALTKQLLGFSRHQSTEITVVDLNQTIKQMTDLISRSVTPQVEVIYHFSKNLWSTEIDLGEFQDTLLNLVINARDAMDGRGHLTLETDNQVLDDAFCFLNPDATPGRYIKLSVSDTGKGIPLELQSRVFEPFFTTKERGKGTGLGLSMVYGFVSRSGGYIKIYSEEGIGTTFNIYLPFSKRQAIESLDTQPEELPRGSETILVVDDEVGLLEVAKDSLEILGYEVLTSVSGKQALDVLNKNPNINLLFSDVVMPGGMNGYELAEHVTTLRPDVRILLTSGYTEKAIAHNGQAKFSASVLGKPYSQVDLARRIKQTLGDKA